MAWTLAQVRAQPRRYAMSAEFKTQLRALERMFNTCASRASKCRDGRVQHTVYQGGIGSGANLKVALVMENGDVHKPNRRKTFLFNLFDLPRTEWQAALA
jgi:hypothetical protein